MRSVYIVTTNSEKRVMLVTRNPLSAAGVYYRERQKLHGERPHVWEYFLGKEYSYTSEPRLIGSDELAKWHQRLERQKASET